MFNQFKEFFKSNDFKEDPYGYLTNQSGHILLGLVIMIIPYLVFEAYLSLVLSTVVVIIFYSFIWELGIQGFKRLDTLEDSFYFSVGSCFWLLLGTKATILLWGVLVVVPLVFGTMTRIRKHNNGIPPPD